MTVRMPSDVKEYDSTIAFFDSARFTIYRSITQNTVLFAFKSKEAVLDEYTTENEKDREVYKIAKKATKEAIMEDKKFFSYDDTTINKLKCIKVEILPINESSDVIPTNAYISFIDGRLYGIAYYSLNDQHDGNIKNFLSGFAFTEKAVEREESLRYKGVTKRELLMVLGLTALIVLIVVFISMARKKPKKERRAF